MITDHEFYRTYEAAIRCLMDALVENRRSASWAKEGLGHLHAFEGLFGEGDGALLDSILNLTPLFDMPCSSGLTVAEEYLASVGNGLPSSERVVLEMLSISAMGWYEVLQDVEHDLIELRDVTTKRQFSVRREDFFEPGHRLEKGAIIWCRIVSKDGEGRFMTTPYEYPSSFKQGAVNLDRVSVLLQCGDDVDLPGLVQSARRVSATAIARFVRFGEPPFIYRAFTAPPWTFADKTHSERWCRIVELISRWAFTEDLRFLWAHLYYSFFGVHGMPDRVGDFSGLVFYYLFGHGIPSYDDATVGELFLDSEAFGRLSAADRRYIEHIVTDTIFSVFEVTTVKKGKGIEVKDLNDGERIFISERMGSEQVKPGDVMVCRLFVKPNGNVILAGNCDTYPKERGPERPFTTESARIFTSELAWIGGRAWGEERRGGGGEFMHPADAAEIVVHALRFCSSAESPDEILETLDRAKDPNAFFEKVDPMWTHPLELERFMEAFRVAWNEFHAQKGPSGKGEPAPGRNAPCPCGSGKKYKKCCLEKLH